MTEEKTVFDKLLVNYCFLNVDMFTFNLNLHV